MCVCLHVRTFTCMRPSLHVRNPPRDTAFGTLSIAPQCVQYATGNTQKRTHRHSRDGLNDLQRSNRM